MFTVRFQSLVYPIEATPVKVQFGVENVGRALLPVFDRDGQECPSYGQG